MQITDATEKSYPSILEARAWKILADITELATVRDLDRALRSIHAGLWETALESRRNGHAEGEQKAGVIVHRPDQPPRGFQQKPSAFQMGLLQRVQSR